MNEIDGVFFFSLSTSQQERFVLVCRSWCWSGCSCACSHDYSRESFIHSEKKYIKILHNCIHKNPLREGRKSNRGKEQKQFSSFFTVFLLFLLVSLFVVRSMQFIYYMHRMRLIRSESLLTNLCIALLVLHSFFIHFIYILYRLGVCVCVCVTVRARAKHFMRCNFQFHFSFTC